MARVPSQPYGKLRNKSKKTENTRKCSKFLISTDIFEKQRKHWKIMENTENVRKIRKTRKKNKNNQEYISILITLSNLCLLILPSLLLLLSGPHPPPQSPHDLLARPIARNRTVVLVGPCGAERLAPRRAGADGHAGAPRVAGYPYTLD